MNRLLAIVAVIVCAIMFWLFGWRQGDADAMAVMGLILLASLGAVIITSLPRG